MRLNVRSYHPRLSPAMVVALLALVVALSSPAQAAMERIAAGTVGTAQLKNGAVTTPKLRHGAVTSPKIRNGTVGLGDLALSARPRLPRALGTPEGTELRFLGDRIVLTELNVPSGTWVVTAGGVSILAAAWTTCGIRAAGTDIRRTYSRNDDATNTVSDSWAMTAIVRRTRSASVQVWCSGPGNAAVTEVHVHATEVRCSRPTACQSQIPEFRARSHR